MQLSTLHSGVKIEDVVRYAPPYSGLWPIPSSLAVHCSRYLPSASRDWSISFPRSVAVSIARSRHALTLQMPMIVERSIQSAGSQ